MTEAQQKLQLSKHFNINYIPLNKLALLPRKDKLGVSEFSLEQISCRYIMANTKCFQKLHAHVILKFYKHQNWMCKKRIHDSDV